MYAVGIRELKAKLSQYIQRVREGEIVLVSDRGRVVAELRAPTVRAVTGSDLATAELVAEGALKPGQPSDPRSYYEESSVCAPEGTAAEVLDWVREGSREGNR